MSLLNKLTKLAGSRQGRRLTNQAMTYARSPKGRRQLEQVRARLTKRGRPR